MLGVRLAMNRLCQVRAKMPEPLWMSSAQGKGQVLWVFVLLPPSHFLLLIFLQP